MRSICSVQHLIKWGTPCHVMDVVMLLFDTSGGKFRHLYTILPLQNSLTMVGFEPHRINGHIINDLLHRIQ